MDERFPQSKLGCTVNLVIREEGAGSFAFESGRDGGVYYRDCIFGGRKLELISYAVFVFVWFVARLCFGIEEGFLD